MEWYSDHSVVLDFATVLVDEGKLKTANDVLYFFEKPWKWTDEYWSHEESKKLFSTQEVKN